MFYILSTAYNAMLQSVISSKYFNYYSWVQKEFDSISLSEGMVMCLTRQTLRDDLTDAPLTRRTLSPTNPNSSIA